MKGSLIALAAFIGGCAAGWAFPGLIPAHSLSNILLYALMLQVGISIGCNGNLRQLIAQLHPRSFLLPLGTIAGTLLFSALASFLLSRWDAAECMAVGSGLGYYSLSSILITQLKTPSIGWQLAAELGTVALLANIFREMFVLLGSPFLRKHFGPLAPVSAAGATSADVALPAIVACSGRDMVPVAILHGILADLSVPFFVPFFCSL